MSIEVACIPITPTEIVAGGWGKASTVAVARVENGTIVSWQVENVGWDELHDAGTEGSHHAMIVRFLTENGVTVVVANHMGPPMQNTLAKMGIRVVLDATGDARTAIFTAIAS